MPKARARRREPALTINGNIAYYYLTCQRCGKPKGRTNRKYCVSCRRSEPRKLELELHCECGRTIDRNALIRAMYYAGMTSPELGAIFKLSANQILSVASKRSKP